MSTHLPNPLVAHAPARLSRGMSAIVIGTLSILCWAVLVAIVLALWELA